MSSKLFDLAGHGALVTGASRGIGHALATGFHQAGSRVVAHGRESRPENLPGSWPYVEADLSRNEAVEQLWQEAVTADPDLDLLVSNAGGFFDVPFLDMDASRWEQSVQLHLTAPYFLVQSFARHRRERGGGGSVVLVSSVNGLQAEPDSTAYDTCKGGLIMMTRTLATSLASLGIRVNALAPGLIHTPLTAPWLDAEPAAREHYEKKILLGRVGTPTDCVGAALFLASEASAYLTGQVLTVDGGLTVTQVGRR